jgi:folate-dependent phosphoribosylglycinamide formyltransferase PurN
MGKAKLPWIAFFSQTGAEIADLSEHLGRWPSRIITNKRPEDLRTIDPRIIENGYIEVSNKPTEQELEEILQYYKEPVITLHGWLRVMPPDLCAKYSIFNGHPGLIIDYPELKGKDPQVRTWEGIQEGKYETAGAVIHRVTEGVDEGKVLLFERFNTFSVESLDDLFKVLRDRSLYMWSNLLKGIVVEKK